MPEITAALVALFLDTFACTLPAAPMVAELERQQVTAWQGVAGYVARECGAEWPRKEM